MDNVTVEITNVRLKITSTNNKAVLAVASIVLNDAVAIHDLQLVELPSGKRAVSFPSKKTKKYVSKEGGTGLEQKDEFSDIVHPINKKTREYIEQELFKVYELEKEGKNE